MSPTLKQINYATSLITKTVRSGSWQDTDAGQYGDPPTHDELATMTHEEISDLISDLKSGW